MNRILRKSAELAAAFIMITAVCFAAAMSTSASTVSISASKYAAGKQYVLTNMPFNGSGSILPRTYGGQSVTVYATQNFAESPDGKYIFTTGEAYTGAKSEGIRSTVLSVCKRPSKTGASAVAECVDSKLLYRYGHGESIAVAQPDKSKEIYYLFVACTPNLSEENNFGKEIMWLTYNAQTKKITKRVRITGMKYPVESACTRVACAVDTTSNKIAFRISTNKEGIFYVFYDYTKLMAALSKVGDNGSYSLRKASKLIKANVECPLRPLYAYQSFDIYGNYIFIAGGATGQGGVIYRVKYKTYADGKAISTVINKVDKKIKITPKVQLGDLTVTAAGLEMEGIQAKSNSNLLVHFYTRNMTKKDTVAIYKITA